MIADEQKINLTISEGLLKNLEGMFYKITSPPDYTLVYASHACLKLTGYTVLELLTIDYINIIHPEDREGVIHSYKNSVDGEDDREYRIVCKDGTIKWVKDISNTSFDPLGGTLDIEGYITDISRQKVEKLATIALKKQHEGLLTELTHKYNELMQFNYIVSHNLRSPIANILGLSEILKFHYKEEASEMGELVNFIADSAMSIDAIIQDLNLILSARKPMNEKYEAIALLELIMSVKNNLKKQIKDSQATFNIAIGPEVATIKSIRSYLQSILYNLISNAIKYKKDDIPPTINISASGTGDGVEIKVSDDGLGMDLHSIGDKLFGLYKKFNFDREGRGLGLHMTKTQIESLGGSISVASELNKGTIFTVFLPFV